MTYLIILIVTVLGLVFGEDAKVVIPKWARRLVIMASQKLPEKDREQFEEEWLSALNETETYSGKIRHGLGLFFVGAPRINRQLTGQTLYMTTYKRVFDIVFALISLLTLMPFIMIVAAVLVASREPVLIREPVVGKGGRKFGMFRLSRPPNMEGGCLAIRRFLDFTGFYETPQLLNVLRGDMSMVGPAIMRPKTVRVLGIEDSVCFKLLPGLIPPPGFSMRVRRLQNIRDGKYVRELAHAWEETAERYLRQQTFRRDLVACFESVSALFPRSK
ncbi:sugar transferase [Tropicimonas marinistellae]|uniref:sugar transferase n=1 Tax=Tropicimonas marinistellae TaxID=1739787 RepID=UPI0008336E96|nr:sugar transferase [Tropicimonas marinistellae]